MFILINNMESYSDTNMSSTNSQPSSLKSSGGASLDVGFVEYITTISSNEKAQMLNLLQYGGLALVPLLILLNVMKMYVPEEDPEKGTTELVIEVVVQLSIVLLALFFIHKLILFVPTYSKVQYESVNLLTIVLPLLFIMIAMETNVSHKLNTLFDRLLMLVGLKKEGYEGQAQQQVPSNTQGPMPPSQSTGIVTESSSVIGENPTMMPPNPMNTMPQQTVQMMEPFQPMAANDSMGGGFGSAF